MPVATNDQGQALRLDDSGQWVPTKMASNPQTGERLVLDGDKWTPIAKQETSALGDALHAIPGGIVKGVAAVVGLPGDAQTLLNRGEKYVGDKVVQAFGGTPYPADHQVPSIFPGSSDISKALSRPTGGFYEPQTTAGRYAETAASFAPGAFGGEASLAGRAVGRILAPAAGSMAAGHFVDAKEHPFLHTAAEIVGALGGAGISGLVGKGASAVGERILTAQEAPEITAQRKLADLLAQQGTAPSTIADNAIPGRGQLAAEALGPQGVTMMATLGRRSGATGQALAEALKLRAQTAPSRILSDVEAASGVAPERAAQQIGSIIDSGRARAAPLYQEAEAATPNTSDYLNRFAQDADVRQGMAVGVRNAQRRALAENKPFDPSAYAVTGFNEAGDPIIGGVPTWKTWDAAKTGLDQRLEQYRNPVTRSLDLDQTGSAIDAVRRSMLSEIDQLNPAYAKARAASADYLSANSAFKQGGAHLLNPRTTAAQADDYFSGLNDANKEAYRAGISNQLYNMAQNARLKPNALLTPAIQQKITTAFGQDKGAQFVKALQDEATLAQTGARMMPGTGSITSDVQMMSPEIDHLANVEAARRGASAVGELLQGNIGGALVKGLGAARHFAPDLLRSGGLNEPARNELGRLLMMPPEELSMTLRSLPPKQKLDLANTLKTVVRRNQSPPP